MKSNLCDKCGKPTTLSQRYFFQVSLYCGYDGKNGSIMEHLFGKRLDLCDECYPKVAELIG